MHESFTENVVSFLYDKEPEETFAAIVERRDSPIGPRTEYFCVETVYDGIARDHDRIMAIQHRRTPSEDYWLADSIYTVEAGGGAEIKHLGPANEDIHAVSEEVLAVDYSSNHHLVATCEECHNSGRVPVSEHELPLTDPILIDDRGETITACCRSANYEISLEADTA